MRRNCLAKRIFDSRTFISAMSVFLGVIVVLLCIVGFSVVLTIIDANSIIKSIMSAISLCLGTFAAGFICAKQKRKNGLLNGLFCGLFIYLIIFFSGIFLLKLTTGSGVFGKILLVCITGAIGGICGVNSRHNFKAAKTKKNRFGT